MVNFKRFLPFWAVLSTEEQATINSTSRIVQYRKGYQMHGKQDMTGVMYVMTGQLRIYIVSEEGREVTLYRVFRDDFCVVAAVGLLDSITFDVMVDAVEDTKVVMMPVSTMTPLLKTNAEAGAFLYRVAASHFSDMVWNMQQIFFLSIDRRIAKFLWDEMERNDSLTVSLTHDEIARYIGSAREVVTKVLRYFQTEGVLTLRRGKIQVTSREKLKEYL